MALDDATLAAIGNAITQAGTDAQNGDYANAEAVLGAVANVLHDQAELDTATASVSSAQTALQTDTAALESLLSGGSVPPETAPVAPTTPPAPPADPGAPSNPATAIGPTTATQSF